MASPVSQPRTVEEQRLANAATRAMSLILGSHSICAKVWVEV